MFRPQGYQSYVGRYTDTQTHRNLKTWGQTFEAFAASLNAACKHCWLAALGQGRTRRWLGADTLLGLVIAPTPATQRMQQSQRIGR